MKHGSLSDLWKAANEITAELDRWIQRKDGRGVRLRFKAIDQARLLRLRVWAWRYKVELQELLDLIMPILRAQVKGKKSGFGLGLRVTTLTGDAAERILAAEVHKRYPDRENVVIWRDKVRQEQLEAERMEELDGLKPREEKISRLLETDSVREFIASYYDRIEQARKRDRIAREQSWRKVKAYRGNPWH